MTFALRPFDLKIKMDHLPNVMTSKCFKMVILRVFKYSMKISSAFNKQGTNIPVSNCLQMANTQFEMNIKLRINLIDTSEMVKLRRLLKTETPWLQVYSID